LRWVSTAYRSGLGLGVFLALAVLLLGMIAQQRLSW
jgi:hypothetical protein